jgi:hypothetical protein
MTADVLVHSIDKANVINVFYSDITTDIINSLLYTYNVQSMLIVVGDRAMLAGLCAMVKALGFKADTVYCNSHYCTIAGHYREITLLYADNALPMQTILDTHIYNMLGGYEAQMALVVDLPYDSRLYDYLKSRLRMPPTLVYEQEYCVSFSCEYKGYWIYTRWMRGRKSKMKLFSLVLRLSGGIGYHVECVDCDMLILDKVQQWREWVDAKLARSIV